MNKGLGLKKAFLMNVDIAGTDAGTVLVICSSIKDVQNVICDHIEDVSYICRPHEIAMEHSHVNDYAEMVSECMVESIYEEIDEARRAAEELFEMRANSFRTAQEASHATFLDREMPFFNVSLR